MIGIKKELIENKYVIVGMLLGTVIGVAIYFASFTHFFKLIFEIPTIYVCFIILFIISYYIVKQQSYNSNDSENGISFLFFFYKNIKTTTFFLTAPLFIFFFLRDYATFLNRYELLQKVLVWTAISMYIYFFLIIISTVLLFYKTKNTQNKLFEVGNTSTTHIQENTVGMIGLGKLLSGEIYLLSILILNIGLIGVVYKADKDIYSIVFAIGIMIYFFWVQNKQETLPIHIIKNSLYALLLLSITIFIIRYSSTVAIQSFNLLKDISKTTELYKKFHSNKIEIQNSISAIDHNISDINSNIHSLVSDASLLGNTTKKIDNDCFTIKRNLSKMQTIVTVSINNQILTYEAMEQFEKSYHITIQTVEKLKYDSSLIRDHTKKTYTNVRDTRKKIHIDIQNVENLTQKIKNKLIISENIV